MQNCTVYKGHARFESPRQVSVGAESITADRIFINVGGRAVVPPLPGLDQVPYLTNSSMMDVDFVPPRLIVVGGSYVGLEFGQMFQRFGSEVSIIEMGPRLVHREDEDVSEAIQGILNNERLNIRLNAKCIAFSKRKEEISSVQNAPRDRPRSAELMCCWPLGGVPTPTTWVWTGPELRSTIVGTSSSTISCKPMSRASGPWATAMEGRIHPHVVQRFGDCRSQSAGQRSAPGQRSDPGVRTVYRPAPGTSWSDRERSPQDRPVGAGGQAAHDQSFTCD